MSVYNQLGDLMHAQRAGAQALAASGTCTHPSTHTERVEHDQLPEQQSLQYSNVEVCDFCNEQVEVGDDN